MLLSSPGQLSGLLGKVWKIPELEGFLDDSGAIVESSKSFAQLSMAFEGMSLNADIPSQKAEAIMKMINSTIGNSVPESPSWGTLNKFRNRRSRSENKHSSRRASISIPPSESGPEKLESIGPTFSVENYSFTLSSSNSGALLLNKGAENPAIIESGFAGEYFVSSYIHTNKLTL